jgi:succinate dehydrogenase cytochrome b subunit
VVGGVGVWSIPNYSTASNVWTATDHFLRNPFFDFGLALIGFAVVYHSINGVRLTLTEFGLLVGTPRRPDFPYVAESLNRVQKAIFWLSIAIAGVATFYALRVLFG